MKKAICIGIFFLLFSIFVISKAKGQSSFVKDDFDKLSFNVKLNKKEYIPLEPVFLELEVVNKRRIKKNFRSNNNGIRHQAKCFER